MRLSKKSFTITELLVAISIIVIISWYILAIFWWLTQSSWRSKIQIDMKSEISYLLKLISDHIYWSDDIEIIASLDFDWEINEKSCF